MNKTGLGFKSGISHNKGFNRKKLYRSVYKCSYSDRFSNLEPFCYDKFIRSKGSNHIPLRATKAPGSKMIWIQNMKTYQECLTILMML